MVVHHGSLDPEECHDAGCAPNATLAAGRERRDDPRPLLLLAPETFDLAETTRMLEVARACRDRFRIAFMCYGGRFVHLVTEAGYACHCLAPHLSERRVRQLASALRMERGGRMFDEGELATRVESELALYGQLRPAAVVTGFILSACISARVARIPLVTVAPLAVTRPFFEAGLGTFPDQFDVGPLRLVPQPIKDAAANWWGLHTRQWLGPFNAVARRHGVRPFSRLVDLVDADEMLITNVPELVGPLRLPPHWHYVGPIFAHLPGEVPDEIRAMPRDRPLVYLSMGSLPDLRVLDRFLDVLGRLPVRVVSPAGSWLRDHPPAALPPNVRLYDLLPAHKVCPLFDVAILHGGEGTVQTACAAGVPFAGIGFTPEQDANIGFLVRRGTAVRLRRRHIDPRQVAAAIDWLRSDVVRARAAELQGLLAAWDGPGNVARFLARHAGALAADAAGSALDEQPEQVVEGGVGVVGHPGVHRPGLDERAARGRQPVKAL